MPHLFELAHDGQHREDRFNDHAIIPVAFWAELQVQRIPLLRMKPGITEDDHVALHSRHQRMEGLIRDIRCGTVPVHDESPLVEQQT